MDKTTRTNGGNGHHTHDSVISKEVRAQLLALAKEYGLLVSPKLRQIGEDDGEEQWFVPCAVFLAEVDMPTEFLIDPFLFAKSFTLVTGPPKAGKTWFLAWLAAECAAAGKRVHFVEQEGTRALLRARLRPFLGPATEAARSLMSIAHSAPLRLDNRKSVDALIRQVKGCDLLILDPFVMLHTRDENDQAEMAIVVQAVLRIIHEVGCAVVLVHHTKKGESWDKHSKMDGASVDVRGSGALVGAADSVISLKGVADEDRHHSEVRFYVSNPDTRLGEPFERKLAVVKLTGDVGAIQFLVPGQQITEEGIAAVLARAMQHIPSAPEMISLSELQEFLELRRARVSAAVRLGVQHGTLKRAREGRTQGVQRA